MRYFVLGSVIFGFLAIGSLSACSMFQAKEKRYLLDVKCSCPQDEPLKMVSEQQLFQLPKSITEEN